MNNLTEYANGTLKEALGKTYVQFRKALGKICVTFKMLTRDVTYWEKVRLLEPNYYKKTKLLEPHYQKKIFYGNAGNDFMRESIGKDLPMMVSRLGGTELDCIEFYLENRMKERKKYPERIKYRIENNAGFFPANEEFLDKFSEFFLDHISNIDIMGVLFTSYEAEICNIYGRNAKLVELGCIEPYHWKNPWSGKLRGKKVLVVHPFTESIRKQYAENRRFLFKDAEILPDFELRTVKAVQSSAGTKVDFPTWYDAYQYMCDEIRKIDFHVAIIGAGAYGLPLASFVKSLGKQGINIGGFTQILFGIKGKRYEIEYADTTAKMFNNYWIRPSKSETPQNYDRVENGCYW
jgi:hypothetical protein